MNVSISIRILGCRRGYLSVMRINGKSMMLFLIAVFFAGIADAQDSLSFPELLSIRYFEESEIRALIRSRIALKNNISYKNTIVIERQPFTLYYRNTGEENDPEQIFSCAFQSRFIQAGIGRGRPHIAQGIILGNTMMRFTPDPLANFRMGTSRLKIKNYEYYPSLYYLGLHIKKMSLSVFQYDDIFSVIGQIRRENIQAGLAIYGLKNPIYESWAAYRGSVFRGSINGSIISSGLSSFGLNHIAVDALISHAPFRWHSGAIRIGSSFVEYDVDSKWGTGLIPGSIGLIGGTMFSTGKWKIRGTAYQIYHVQQHEKRLLLDVLYRKAPYEIGISYIQKRLNKLNASEVFPYALEWHKTQSGILKTRMKIKINETLKLDSQIQADILKGNAFSVLYRLTYRSGDHILRLQVTHGRSDETILYLLRPMNYNRYVIQRIPTETATYIDLVYSFMLRAFRCSILINNDGIAGEIEMRIK